MLPMINFGFLLFLILALCYRRRMTATLGLIFLLLHSPVLAEVYAPTLPAPPPIDPLTSNSPPTLGLPPHQWNAPNGWDYFSTVALGVTGLWVNSAAHPLPVQWTGGIFIDDAVRNSMVLSTQAGREAADTASYVTLGAALAAPFAIDAVIYSGLIERDFSQAVRTAFIALQAFVFNFSINEPIKAIVSRARPYTTGCEKDGSGYSPACGTKDANRSFYSGHSSTAFTAAGLLCRNHLSLGLARSQSQNFVVCTSALTIAAATAVLRISADRHYLSDVLTGATIGFAVGYFLPKLLYSFEDAKEPTNAKTSAVILYPISGGLGAQIQYQL